MQHHDRLRCNFEALLTYFWSVSVDEPVSFSRMQNPAHKSFPFGRAMLVDSTNCSLSLLNGHICMQKIWPPASACFTCNICEATHFCSALCHIMDVQGGWHQFLDLKIKALGAALPVYLPHFLAWELRDLASSRALDILLAGHDDINRPMIPTLFWQLRREEDALGFIAGACPIPRMTQTQTLRMLMGKEGSERASVHKALYIAETGEAGLAYAAIIALIKLGRYVDNYRARLKKDRSLRTTYCSVLSASDDKESVGIRDRNEAEEDLLCFVTAVFIRQEDFWEKLLYDLAGLQAARTAAGLGYPGAVEVIRGDAVSPTAPQINALSWVLPAWWAASAPGSENAAHALVNVLVLHYGCTHQRLLEGGRSLSQ